MTNPVIGTSSEADQTALASNLSQSLATMLQSTYQLLPRQVQIDILETMGVQAPTKRVEQIELFKEKCNDLAQTDPERLASIAQVQSKALAARSTLVR